MLIAQIIVSGVSLALLFGFMAGMRFVAVHAVYDYGLPGWLALMAAIFAVTFWVERKWPSPPPGPPGTSAATVARLNMAGNVDLVVMAVFTAALMIGLVTFSKDWLAYWLIPYGVIYVRYAVVSARRDKRLVAEDVIVRTDRDQPAASGNDTPLPPSIRQGRIS
jgi:hypothetical protein